MATTTNYSWTTPDDTALVKDGAAAIRSLGTSIDTTTKNLNPSTTLGDIEYRSSTANTNTRLGIGTTGQVLTVSGGVPAWATASSGGMTLLSTTTLSGASTTISSISQDYNILYAVITGLTSDTTDGTFRCAPNGTTNAANGVGTYVDVSSTGTSYFTSDRIFVSGPRAPRYDNSNNIFVLRLDNYTSTTNYKAFHGYATFPKTGNTQADIAATTIAGGFWSNTAITSLVFSVNGSSMTAGSVKLYGVK
jgi:hypothetical protein